MKTILLFLCQIVLLLSVFGKNLHAQNTIDYISALKDTLNAVSGRTDNVFLKIHCQSMVDVINAKTFYSSADINFLKNTYLAFNNEADNANAKKLSTYLNRKRPFIISWISPTDGQISFSWVTPPANWNPDKSYPLYVQLHGLWSVASNTIEYLTYPYVNALSASFAFEDGYLLAPWGRGNLWYQGISETDIWECMSAFEKQVSIDPKRKYLCGHSMGGYGTWHIAQSSPQTWAAIGLHAAALYYMRAELDSYTVNKLKNVPVFFICGTTDSNLGINKEVLQMLLAAGNKNVTLMTFIGGHVYYQSDVETMYSWMRRFENTNVTINAEVKADISPSQMSAFPNPFSTKTLIKYSLSKSSNVKLEIYNSQGCIIDIIEDLHQVAGVHEVSWTPENLPDGVYYYCLTTDYSRSSHKVIFRK